MTPSEAVEAAAPPVVVEDIVEIVLVLTLVGFCAPQGWSSTQAAAQVLSEPQAA